MPETKMRPGQTDILAYRNDLETEFRDALAGKFEEDHEDIGEWIDSRFLEVNVWRNETCKRRVIVEILLTCGGPTVCLTWDSRWTVAELSHSWGVNAHTGAEQTVIEFRGEIIDALADYLGIERGN